MKRFSFGSLRVRLILLVLLAVIPALGITLYSGLELRDHMRQGVLVDALRLAKDISETHDRLIQNARQILFALSKTSEVQQQDKAACSKIFADIMKQSEGYTALFATKPNGDLFASSLPITHPVNFADRPWFQRLLKTRDFVIGEYLIGRISGKPLIVLALPVFGDIGNLKAILSLGMDLEWLNKTVVKSKLPEGTSVSVIDSNGTVLFRYPEPEKFVGKSMPEASIMKAILAKREGVEETVGLGGVPRLFGFTSLGKGVESVHVTVGIPRQIALATADRVMKDNFTYLGLIALLALAAAWFMGGYFIIHPVNRLLDTTKQLANGDLTVRTGPPYREGEIGQLARAFDQMAASLEQREAERKRAEEALRKSGEKFRELFDHAPVGYHEFDIEGRITNVSRTELEMLGYTLEERIGQFIWSSITEEEKSRQTVLSKLAGVIQPSQSLERIYRRKDGTTFPALIQDQLLLDEKGRITGMRSTIQDITERKRAEEEREKLVRELQKTLAEVKTLKGIFPICASCKKIRDDKGYWNQVEVYIRDHSEAEFSHGICPECMKKLYPDFADEEK